MNLTPGQSYEIAFECRDIGYGIEDGEGWFVYEGIDAGKLKFVPVGSDAPTIWLFDNEIKHYSSSLRALSEEEKDDNTLDVLEGSDAP